MSKNKDIKKEYNKIDNYTLIGTVVTFPKNKIHFYQDHSFWEGIPTDIEFTVVKEAGHNDYWLAANGYGNPKSYGNGKIAVREKDIKWALSQQD